MRIQFLKDIYEYHLFIQYLNSITEVTTTDEMSENAVHHVDDTLNSPENDYISPRLICFTHFSTF